MLTPAAAPARRRADRAPIDLGCEPAIACDARQADAAARARALGRKTAALTVHGLGGLALIAAALYASILPARPAYTPANAPACPWVHAIPCEIAIPCEAHRISRALAPCDSGFRP
jgi:hypothetical protein